MAEDRDEEMLQDMRRVLYEADDVELPSEILELMREADATLREERSLFSAVKRRLHDLSTQESEAFPAPSLAFEGEDEEEEDPVSEVLKDEEE